MKRFLIFTAALALSAVAWFVFAPAPQPVAESMAAPVPLITPSDEKVIIRTNDDAGEVFRRAFWREPAAEDRILHAERREWVSEADGVRRWQWFITVQPGPALVTWLRESNPFNLVKVDRVPSFQGFGPAPGWFPPPGGLAGCEFQQSAGKEMTIIINAEKNLVYATDGGRGFAAAQTLASAQPTQASSTAMPPREWEPRR